MIVSLPVWYDEASLAKYKNNPLISLTWPIRPRGVIRYASLMQRGEAPILVSKKPGETILTLAKSRHSLARLFPRWLTAALVVL